MGPGEIMSEENTTVETETKQPSLPGIDESARKEAAENKAKMAELEATIAKLTKANKDASKANASAAELKAALEAKEAEEEKARAMIKAYEDGLEARAARMLAKLDDEGKAYVEKYKGKLSKSDWVEMIEERVEMGTKAAPMDDEAPPAPTPGGGRIGTKKHELNPKSREILEHLGYDPDGMDHGSKLAMHDSHTGNARFEVQLKDMLARLKRGTSTSWTADNARKRKGM